MNKHSAIVAIWIGTGMTAFAGECCAAVAIFALLATAIVVRN